MGKLTGTRHGHVATELLAFYRDKAHELEESGQYFMPGNGKKRMTRVY